MSRWIVIIAAAAAAATVALLWYGSIPLGVPGEWTWPRVPFDPGDLLPALMLLGAGALYLLVAIGGDRSHDVTPRRRRAMLPLLAVAGFVWMWSAAAAVPGVAGTGRAPFVLFYQRSSGYFWQARYEVRSTRDFLRTYEDRLAERDYLHIGTHPPGLTVTFRGLLNLLDACPVLVTTINWAQPEDVRASSAEIVLHASASGRDYGPKEQACLWLAALAVMASAAATVFPLHALAAELTSPRAAWRAAALWPLVPALVVFWPKSDVLYAFPSALSCWLWVSGWRRGSAWRCGAAGVVLGAGMLLSLAFAPVGAALAVWWLVELGSRRSPEGGAPARWPFRMITAGAAGFAALPVILWISTGLNTLSVWRWNMANHALFYDHNTRTYARWLLANPLELACAVGAPLAIAALCGLLVACRRRQWFGPCCVAVWIGLWLSGKNMGEAARLWILFMPWLAVLAAHAFDATEKNAETDLGLQRRARQTWIALLVMQLVVTALTATRIDGFQFNELQTTPERDTAFVVRD